MREADWEAITVECIPLGSANDGVKLRADILPRLTLGSNLRGMLRQSTWDRLRFATADAADNQCEVCGNRSLGPNQKVQRPDCHEAWVFEKEGSQFTQRLNRLVALCKLCHNVQHVGRGFTSDAVQTLQDLNGWSAAEALTDIKRAMTRVKLMNNLEFNLDLSVLSSVIELTDYPNMRIPAIDRIFLGNTWLKQPYEQPGSEKLTYSERALP